MTGWDRTSERQVDVISGAAMFVRADAMQEVGLLDEASSTGKKPTGADVLRRPDGNWSLLIPEITHFGNGSAGKLNHRRDVLMTEGTTRLHLKHKGLLPSSPFHDPRRHNASRACSDSAGVSIVPAKARKRLVVTCDLPKAWPSSQCQSMKVLLITQFRQDGCWRGVRCIQINALSER